MEAVATHRPPSDMVFMTSQQVIFAIGGATNTGDCAILVVPLVVLILQCECWTEVDTFKTE